MEQNEETISHEGECMKVFFYPICLHCSEFRILEECMNNNANEFVCKFVKFVNFTKALLLLMKRMNMSM